MTITIRPLQASDREAWNSLWQGYLSFYEEDLPEAVTELTWRRLMTEGEDPNGFAALDAEGNLLGFTHYLFHRSTWAEGPYCYLEDLFVSEAARGKGAARVLIKAVKQAAEDAGAARLYWTTQHFNEDGRRLYDRVGQLTPFIK